MIEAVFEDLDVKRKLFGELDRVCAPETRARHQHLAASTCATSRGGTSVRIAFVGLHYFYHPAKNRLVEVIAGAGPAPETLRLRVALRRRSSARRRSASADAPGFVVNRYFVPWINEAVRLLDEGVADIPTIEAAAKEAFRIGMGPFELMNVTGIPIALHAATTLGASWARSTRRRRALARQVERGQPLGSRGAGDAAARERVAERLLAVTFLIAGHLVDEGVCTIEDCRHRRARRPALGARSVRVR